MKQTTVCLIETITSIRRPAEGGIIMARISLVLALSLGLAACTGDSLPTAPIATESETESVSSVLSKSPRIDGPPIPPVFFNALNPEPFVDFREWPEWVPISFYREMSCTPHDINFLSTEFDSTTADATLNEVYHYAGKGLPIAVLDENGVLIGALDPRDIMEEMGRVERLIDGFEREVYL